MRTGRRRGEGHTSAPLRRPRRLLGPSSLAWPAVTSALPLAYGVGLWLVARHRAAGVPEVDELPLLLHWLRDATLLLPAVVGATLTAMAGAARLERRSPGNGGGRIGAAARVAATSLATAAVVGLTTPLHARFFPEVHVHGAHAEGVAHSLAEATAVLPVALLISALAAAFAPRSIGLAPRSGRPSPAARPARRPIVGIPVLTSVLLVALVAGDGIAVPAEEGNASATGRGIADVAGFDERLDLLRDRIDPCVDDSPLAPPFLQTLTVPPALSAAPGAPSAQFDITETRSETEIIPGIRTPIWGYDGITPGPTILARKGQPVSVTFHNRLPVGDDPSGIILKPPPTQEHPFTPSSTVVHLHGMTTDQVSDGYPENKRVAPGQPRVGRPPFFPPDQTHLYPNLEDQRPATLWYHDHSVHITGEHIYRGLAAFYLLSDEVEDALPLPKGYGVHDIPLLVKDVMIDPGTGRLLYDNCSHHGAYGDVMTVNGRQQPRFGVGTAKYRLRFLDGSDARQYLLALRPADRMTDPTADQPFTVIGSDHGLLETPQPVTSFHVTPAERVEVVVDFARYPVGTRLVLVNKLVPEDKPWFPIMAFDVDRVESDASQVMGRPEPPLPPVAATRTFVFDRQGGYFSINSRQWDPERVDARPGVDTFEEWVLVNKSGGWGHPIHMHLGRFKILSIDGRPPRPGESGWKDTVWLGPNQTVRVAHGFFEFPGRFAFHCHNSSHEDHDMMSQFETHGG